MNKKFSDFYVGQIATFNKIFEENDFKKFLEISGDNNSLHWDKDFAKNSPFKQPIVPLKLTTAPISKVAGMIFPGEPSLLLTSEIKAIKPIFYGEKLVYSACIESISLSTKLLGIRILVIRGKDIVIDAFIKVKVLTDEWEQKEYEGINYLKVDNENQNYLITGATGELGSAISLRLAKKGYKLILVYRNQDEKIENLKNNLNKIKASYQLIKIDLSTNNFKSKFIKELEKIDLSLGISGIIHSASCGVEDELEKLVKVNYSSLVDIVDLLLPRMLIRHKSSIIFISSIAVIKHIGGWHNYIAAKTMATSYLSGLNKNLSNYGLKCTTIMPGFINTNYSKKYRNGEVSLLPGEVAEEVISLSKYNYPELLKIEPQNKEVGAYQNCFKFGSLIEKKEEVNIINKNNSEKNLQNKQEISKKSIQKKLNQQFNKILNIEENICNEELSIESNPKWDSLNHFQLIASIENEFSIKFDSSEINNITSYSSLLKIISEKY